MMTTLVKLLHIIHVFKQYAKQITVETYRSMLTVVTQNVALLIFVNLNVNLLNKWSIYLFFILKFHLSILFSLLANKYSLLIKSI